VQSSRKGKNTPKVITLLQHDTASNILHRIKGFQSSKCPPKEVTPLGTEGLTEVTSDSSVSIFSQTHFGLTS